MALGAGVGLGPGDILLDGDPAAYRQNGAQPPIFRPCRLWRMARGVKMPLGTEVGLGPGDIVLDGDPVPLPQKVAQQLQSPIFGQCLLWQAVDGSRCHVVRR